MKNRTTRITRVLVVLSLLAVVLTSVLIPSSASKAGTDPIFSGSDYGITFNDGVYTISIDAERLMEILTSKSFDKSTLLSIMPEKVYDLLVNRDAASAAALLRDLADTADFGQLKENLPIDYFVDQFSADELIELIYVDKLLDIIDIDAIITSLSAEEIKALFREGELDKLYESLDLSGILDEDKIKYLFDEVNNPNPLTTDEIINALKDGAINRLILNKSIDLENLLEKSIIEKLFDESDIITDAELQSVLNSKTMIKKILEDEDVLNEILHNEILLEDLAAHPEVIDDLVSDQVIVEIFIDNGLLDTIVASSTIPAAKLKEIVFENDIDVASLITPSFIAGLDPAVINSLISSDDIAELVECLSDEELEEIFNKNSSAIDTSSLTFNNIYPEYISAAEIKSANVIDDADMNILAGLLESSEKNAIGADIDFNSIGGFDYIYDNNYITNQDIIDADVISDADITVLTSAPYLSDAEKDALAALGYTDINAIAFDVLFPTYISVNEIKAANVISSDDVTKLAAAISDDDKVEIAIALDLIDIESIATYFTAEEIKNANVITDIERNALAACLTPEEKIELALKYDCFDKSNFDYTELASYISFDELKAKGVITDAELEALDAQIFVDAGLTATDVFNALGTEKAAQIAIDIYSSGKILDGDGNVIGNEFLHLEGIDFEEVIDTISDTERTAIVEEIKSVAKIKEHLADVISADFSLLAHALDYPKLYKNGIITDDMIFNIVSDEDITKILDRGIVTPAQIIDNMKNINDLTSEIVISKIPFDKLLSAFNTSELIDAVMDQNKNGLIKALDLKKLIKLEAVQAQLRNFSLAEIKAVLNLDGAKDMITAKVFKFINTDLKAITLNGNIVQTSYTGFDIAAIERALLDAIPTFDKLADMDSSGKFASFVLRYNLDGKVYTNGYQIVFTGDTTELKNYAAKIVEYVSFKSEMDGSITTKFTAPAKVAELYVAAVDGTKLPAAIRTKLAEIANVEFNKSDIGDLADAIISKLTIEELRAVISAINVKNLDQKLLAQLDLRESQAQIILDYAEKALNKMASFIETNPELNVTLSSFYDKTLADFYVENGVFTFNFDTEFDVMAKIEKLKELPDDIKIFFTNTTLTHKVSATVEFRNLYKVDFVKDGEVIYTAFRTPGTPIENITDAAALNGMGAHGWDMLDADGNVTLDVSETVAGDIQLTERHAAKFNAYDSNGDPVSEDVIYFSEFTHDLADLTVDKFAPVMTEIDHYTFVWDDFTVTEYADFTVNGQYIADIYKITFVADGNIVDEFEYTIEDYVGMPVPAVPAKDHYTGAWETYTLFSAEEITVNAIYTADTYKITFVADGNIVDEIEYTIEDYTTLTAPAVPAKDHYTGAWETYTLFSADEITVNAIYTADIYKITFVADGNIVSEIEYTIENYTTLTAPAVPDRDHYTGAWETYTLFSADEITVNAIYTADTYKITFVAGSNTVAELEYTIENYTTLAVPAVPDRDHYIGAWETFTLFSADEITVNAIYTAKTYSIIFMANGIQIGATQYYTIEQSSIQQPADSDIPERIGFRAYWPAYTLEYREGQIVNAVYVSTEAPIFNYYITFVDEDGNAYGRVEFNQYTNVDTLKAPEALPTKTGYKAYWPEFKHLVMNYELFLQNGTYSFTVTVEYEAIKYAVVFKVDGVQVGETQYYTIEDKTITPPAVPEKEGYTGAWEEYTLDIGDKEINAVYTAKEYKITFVADGKTVEEIVYTIENYKDVKAPVVPAKDHYTGAWETYTLLSADEITVDAIYTPVTYYLTFADKDGNVIEKIAFTTETDPSTVKAPSTTPELAGYNVSWPSFTLLDNKRFEETGTLSFTVTAKYELINYTATFMADGKVIAEIPFTVETESIEEPAIPAKDGYTAAWNTYTLGTEDITIDAIYSTVSYKVTFIADGEEVAVRYYTVENKQIDEPAVPEKEGYTGAWEEYTLDSGDKEVNAIYAPVEEVEGASYWWIILLIILFAVIVAVVIYIIIKNKKNGIATV